MSEDVFYAWVAREPDGKLYRVGASLPGLGEVPLMGRSMDVMEKTRRLAQLHAQATGRRVWLRRYDTWTDLEDA